MEVAPAVAGHVQQVTRVARRQRHAAGCVKLVQDIGQQRRVEVDVKARRLHAPDALEGLRIGVAEVQLVADSAQEGAVGQIQRVEVGRKHQQHVERQAAMTPAAQVEEVFALFERHDPAIEQLLGRHALAT